MAELTIDQALQQGIEAHKAGQVQEADRLATKTTVVISGVLPSPDYDIDER